MFTVEQLTNSFKTMTREQKNTLFTEITKNIQIYHKMFPGLPLLSYILNENSVPEDQHGMIIRSYKEWKANKN